MGTRGFRSRSFQTETIATRRQAQGGGFHTGYGIRIYERSEFVCTRENGRPKYAITTTDDLWAIVKTLLHELEHAARALGRKDKDGKPVYVMPAKGQKTTEDENAAGAAGTDQAVSNIQSRMEAVEDADGNNELEKAEAYNDREVEEENRKRSTEWTRGVPEGRPATTRR